jgi:uncharacterized membrane protein
MHLHRDDIKEMLEILEKFPETEVVEVIQDSSSGIGSHTTMRLTTNVNGVDGTLEVVISSVENW